MTTETIEFSNDQQEAIDQICEWLDDHQRQQILTLGGYAGTGKTTIIKHLVEMFREKDIIVSVCAFTGKAANVLRRKGVAASTMHSLMYQPRSDQNGKLIFQRVPNLDCDLVIVDEASMVNDELLSDLKSFRLPILAVGDHGQLEPIGNDPGLMKNPDIRLEVIHRQEGDNSIIPYANELRQGTYPTRIPPGENVKIIRRHPNMATVGAQADQVICAYNKTRVRLNHDIRQIRGYESPIVVGDKLICLKNNRDLATFNGEMFIVKSLGDFKGSIQLVNLERENGMTLTDVPIDMGIVEEGTMPKNYRPPYEIFKTEYGSIGHYGMPFTYGYAITAHKSQGSSWGKVLVIDEGPCTFWDYSRWAYTAATRAEEFLIYAV